MADDDIRDLAHAAEDPWKLLGEWMEWWAEDPDAPAKLPDALQVRTAIALVERAHETGELHIEGWRCPGTTSNHS